MSADQPPNQTGVSGTLPIAQNENDLTNQSTNTLPPLTTTSQRNKCGLCGGIGHNRRTCPNAPRNPTANQNAVPRTPQTSSIRAPTPQNVQPITLDKCYYIIFDIKTTGFSKNHHNIIQIAAQILD